MQKCGSRLIKCRRRRKRCGMFIIFEAIKNLIDGLSSIEILSHLNCKSIYLLFRGTLNARRRIAGLRFLIIRAIHILKLVSFDFKQRIQIAESRHA